MMHDICLIQVLDYEAQNNLNKKNKKVLECKNCPIKDKCDKKQMELEGNLKPFAQPVTESIAMPAMRETMDIMVDGHLQKVYKDEIEKQIQQSLFPDMFIKYGC